MLRDLQLRDFRCFDQLVFEPSPGLNLIIGPNAQGKTSLLEAACVLLRLQSPRSSSLIDAVRFNQPGFGLDGHWNDHHLRLKFTDSLKAFALDSKPQSRSADYLAVARVSWISNDDMQLVRGPGSHRRRYLDFLGAQVVPNYLSHLRAYERALRSRNALLREGRFRREIDAFERPLIDAGEALLSARGEICADLRPRVAGALRLIAKGSEMLEISYKAGSPPDLSAALRASRDEEIRLRTTIIGPHRDDIEILLEGRQAVSFASEGQQRSIALAMKLGQARRLEASAGGSPLYLIDDVFGELDPDRRNNLLAALPASAQKLVTATTLHWLESNEEAVVHLLGDGKIAKKKE
ncbi:MAG: DNA replication and repair protein RecF [Terrimicrobiaceae bacterium]